MNVYQTLLAFIEQLPEEKLSSLLALALALENNQESREINQSMNSQAYQEWLGTENDIYDELFADKPTAR